MKDVSELWVAINDEKSADAKHLEFFARRRGMIVDIQEEGYAWGRLCLYDPMRVEANNFILVKVDIPRDNLLFMLRSVFDKDERVNKDAVKIRRWRYILNFDAVADFKNWFSGVIKCPREEFAAAIFDNHTKQSINLKAFVDFTKLPAASISSEAKRG